MLLIDLDHFKLINDQFGHAAGDAVLIAVARRLRDTMRETDMIVRWGGEEFLVYVPLAPADRLDEIVQRIMHAVSEEPIQYMGHTSRSPSRSATRPSCCRRTMSRSAGSA